MLLYLTLLEENKDLWTLEKAYTYLRTDKRVPSDYIIAMLGCTFFLDINRMFSVLYSLLYVWVILFLLVLESTFKF
jgi:hypothetical protein